MKELSRREFLRAAGGLALGSFLPPLPHSALPRLSAGRATASVQTLNVLLVTIDTLRADSIGLDGNRGVMTPNLDRLGKAGTWFTNAICQQPNTNASHTSIFTGLFPFAHGVRFHMTDRLSPGVRTLAEILGQAGYETGGLYSWIAGEKGFSGLRGFKSHDNITVQLSPLVSASSPEGWLEAYRTFGEYLFLPGLAERMLESDSGPFEDHTLSRADLTTSTALRWLDAYANGSSPFFLWVHYFDPHYPYIPQSPFDKMYDPGYEGSVDGSMKTIHYIYTHGTGNLTPRDVSHLHALYDGEITFADQQLGRLLDELDRLGLTDNTLVVATSDHGESLGTLGRWFHGPRTNYTDIHVPVVMRLSSVLPSNHPVGALVESVDIMPTILDLLGLDKPNNLHGVSLVPLIERGVSEVHSTAITMLDSFGEISSVTPDSHLIWDRKNGKFSLYDYRTDPLEIQNLTEKKMDVVGRLFDQLDGELRALRFPNA